CYMRFGRRITYLKKNKSYSLEHLSFRKAVNKWDGYNVLNRNKELDFMFDWELIEEKSRKIMLKQLATESVFGSIAKTVIQSEFKVKKDDKYVKDSVYY